MENLHKVIVIGGPTASGKTALAIEIAQYLRAEIISADSRQCYKELNIGVARPSQIELNTVPHHFIASNSITENINAGYFEAFALEKIKELSLQNNFTVIVGGTGLYIKALMEGLDDIPAIDVSLRKKLIDSFEEKGLVWLQDQIQALDKEYWQQAEQQNPQRLLRALEVYLQTGKSVLWFRKNQKKIRPFQFFPLLIDIPRQELYQKINQRVVSMIENGLIEEVKQLVEFKEYNALQTVGYKEVFALIDNEISLDNCTNLIQQNTRHYAKRQITWFNKQEDFIKINSNNWETLLIQRI